MTEERKKRLKRKLIAARLALAQSHGDFALPLWDILFVATEDVCRVSTNGNCIYFDADWLQKLSDEAVQFILAHELMHIQLRHIQRSAYYRGDRFHLACDIVANSYLKEMGWTQAKLPGVGIIYSQTFFPKIEGRELTAQEAMKCVPFDPAACKPAERRRYMIDSEQFWERKHERGESGTILLHPGEDEDLPPSVKEEEEAELIPKWKPWEFELLPAEVVDSEPALDPVPAVTVNEWVSDTLEALQALREQKQRRETDGVHAEFRERIWNRSSQASLRWQELLHRYVQAEVCDYSFLPPDRRMADTGFFLPDFNAPSESPVKVWFMVDTSASISDEVLDAVYAELCGALSQMGGRLEGYLGFFDMRVYRPVPFSDPEDLASIKPRSGGGTDFSCIFEYLERQNETPDSLVIFTDGDGEFPKEKELPVLWLFTDRNATAPWGSAAFVSIT